eukprot:TRINITY_DN8488_c0_g1_i1.p1 TRINITY_DN8488_c0_g1~~TRINITY_DN8488_c0_g1_i1.p1  ORF type:complete len:271 (-),score=51.58 TRINITY_DN8488_c0_g1_i1:95-907(-)
MGNSNTTTEESAEGPTPCNLLGHILPSSDKVLTRFGNATSEALPQKLKVIVWNIYKGRKADFGKEFEELSSGSDLVLLQEMVLGNDNISPLYECRSDLQWEHATNFIMADNQVRAGVGTGSTSKPLSIDFRVTDDLEPFVKLPKTIIITRYAIHNSSQQLLVLNIHGINFRGTQGLENQINQVLPLIQAHQGPVLFAGDFNTKNNERVVTLGRMLQSVGLESVVWENPLPGKQLDQAYVRGIGVERAFIRTAVNGSDHPLLWLEISIKDV